MWYKTCSREDLIDLIERDGASELIAHKSDRFDSLRVEPSRLLAYWKYDPRQGSSIPAGVVVSPDELRDFIAWVATYVSLRPFTAYCRIVDTATVEYFPRIGEPSLGQFENCYLGIILAECTRKSRSSEAVKRLSPNDFEGTLSFALARSVALGPGEALFGQIEAQWKKAKALISPREDSNDTKLLLRVFRIASALDKRISSNTDDEIILDCAHEIVRLGEIQGNNWIRLTREHPQLRSASEIQKLRREERVQLLRRVVDASLSAKDPLLPFAIGYLGSTIAPGTFDHYGMMNDLELRAPGIILWYGFCAGLYRKNSLQSFSGGVGRRVVRDLERNDSVFARPYCDISVSELDVLLNADKRFDFKIGLPGTIEIELAPCITTFHTLQQQRTEKPDEVLELLRELDYKIQEVLRTRNRLMHLLGPSEQTTLFPAPRGRGQR